MDCKMPEQDGYETTRMIRDQEQQMGKGVHIPIIAMTANALAGDREACFESGMDEYLSKPLQPDRTKEVLSQWFVFLADDTPARLNTGANEDAPPPMDSSRLHMVAETDAEKIALLEIFFTLTREIVATMEDSRRSEEFTQWKNAAHKLKGAAANMGMTLLESICRESEKAANSTYSQRSALLRQMKDEIAHIKAYIAEKSPPPPPPEI
jgi:HPt (histidine-containing phosphotransfer) domain-containing protein